MIRTFPIKARKATIAVKVVKVSAMFAVQSVHRGCRFSISSSFWESWILIFLEFKDKVSENYNID